MNEIYATASQVTYTKNYVCIVPPLLPLTVQRSKNEHKSFIVLSANVFRLESVSASQH